MKARLSILVFAIVAIVLVSGCLGGTNDSSESDDSGTESSGTDGGYANENGGNRGQDSSDLTPPPLPD